MLKTFSEAAVTMSEDFQLFERTHPGRRLTARIDLMLQMAFERARIEEDEWFERPFSFSGRRKRRVLK